MKDRLHEAIVDGRLDEALNLSRDEQAITVILRPGPVENTRKVEAYIYPQKLRLFGKPKDIADLLHDVADFLKAEANRLGRA